MILLTSWFRRRRRARRRRDDSAELGLSLHYDDARRFSDQTPVTPANHAEMLSVAEQHGIADATRPVHDADSLSTGERPLEFLRRLEAWGRVKVTEAHLRIRSTRADQQSVIGAISAAERVQAEAEQEAERARAEAESAKKECTATLGPAATARVESDWPVFFFYIIIIAAFAGEVFFNIFALETLRMGTAETVVIAFVLGAVIFIFATQIAHIFQNQRRILGISSTLLFAILLIAVCLMLTRLRQHAMVNASTSSSGASDTNNGTVIADVFNWLTSTGLFSIQLVFPITIGIMEYLDHPVARRLRKTLNEARDARARFQDLLKKHADLRERLEAAEARENMLNDYLQDEVELIDRIVEDAKEAYLIAFIQAAGDPEVTSALEQRLEAIEGGRPTASPMRPRLRTVGGEGEA